MKQITKEQAIAIAESEIWKDWTDEQVVLFQLFQRRLAMPFDVFHRAIEKVLGRSVWTHEFAYTKELIAEYLGLKPKPTFKDIVNLIPEEKRVVVFHD
jgi:hypothetical protein